MRRILRFLFIAALFIYIAYCEAVASPYFEVGTSFGGIKNGDAFFNQSGVSGSSFVGSFNLYVPITPVRYFTHLDLGIQNRLTTFTTPSGQSLAMETSSLGARLEIGRFYVGAGYAPFTTINQPGSGLMGLRNNTGASAYYGEGGVLWRMIPELQIALCYGVEYGTANGAGSHLSSTEYGLRFRFPFSPKENAGKGEVKFDGFRYPFGFMK